MGMVTSLLSTDFTPTADLCERVTVAMGEGASIDGRLLVWAEYDTGDEVVVPFVVIYDVDGVMLGRFGLNHAINLTVFDEPFVIFPRALTWGDGGKPVKLMFDCWAAESHEARPVVAHIEEDLS